MQRIIVMVTVETSDDEVHGFTRDQLEAIAEDTVRGMVEDELDGEGFKLIQVKSSHYAN